MIKNYVYSPINYRLSRTIDHPELLPISAMWFFTARSSISLMSRQPCRAVSITFDKWSKWNRCDISNNTMLPDIGNAATVNDGPPIISSWYEISTSGTSPFAKLAVQAITYSFNGIPERKYLLKKSISNFDGLFTCVDESERRCIYARRIDPSVCV